MKDSCRDIRPLLDRYVDGEADPAQAERVRGHLDACADCRRELAELERLSHLVREVHHPELAEDYWELHRRRVWKRIREDGRPPQRFYRPSFVWPKLATLAGAAMVVLVVVVAGWRMLGEKRLLMTEPVVGSKAPAVVSEQRAPAERGQPPVAGASAQSPLSEPRAPDVVSKVDDVLEMDRVHSEEGGVASKGLGAGEAAAQSEEKTGAAATVSRKTGIVDIAGSRRQTRFLEAKPESGASRAAGLVEAERPSRAGAARSSQDAAPVLLAAPDLSQIQGADTGTAIVRVVTDSNGAVIRVALRRSSGVARLDSMALAMARKSKVRAALKDGKPVGGSLEVPYQFKGKKAERKPRR
jgi:TonB family protein